MLNNNVYALSRLISQINKRLLKKNLYKSETYYRKLHNQNTTFKMSILKFFGNLLKEKSNIKQNVKSDILNTEMASMNSVFYKENKAESESLQNIPKDKLELLINSIELKKSEYKLSHNIDMQCCSLLHLMSNHDILRVLISLTKSIPSQVASTNFYMKSIEKLKEDLLHNSFDKNTILVLIYCFGLSKKKGAKNVKTALKYLPDFNKLSLFEQSIVAETAFKCGVKLLQPQIECIEKGIEKESKYLVTNDTLLVSLCKILRHSGTSKEFAPINLSKEIIIRKEQYNMVTSIHILKLYAEIYYADFKALQKLVSNVLAHINSSTSEMQESKKYTVKFSLIYNTKYIDGFLWALSRLNYNLTASEVTDIRKFICRIQFQLFKQPTIITNVILSLWILGYKAEDLIQQCVTKKVFLHVQSDKHWKHQTRLNLLLQCIQIECPHIKIPVQFNNIKVTMQVSETVKKLCNILDKLRGQLQLQNIVINCPIKSIYIAGVTFTHSSLGSFHVDLLSDTTCLRFQRTPHGLMNLKLRLLKQLGYQSIIIDESYMTDAIHAFVHVEQRLAEVICNY